MFTSGVRRTGAYILDVVSLGKPNIIVLLLITTSCSMLLAGHGVVDLQILFTTLLGGGLISASANAVNCIWDRDIDAVMMRTRNRPLPQRRLSLSTAAAFAAVTGCAGFLLLLQANAAAALAGLAGHLVYVLVYTLWLKRTSVQNIVIGGAAGAIPPVVGWLAVTGQMSISAVCLFLLIFFWTPPHFWALALVKRDDYRRAGVPMLPAVRGEESTCRQMLVYALLLIPVSVALVASNPDLSIVSLVSLTGLAVIFAGQVARLFFMQQRDARVKAAQAWRIFSFSLIYLALVFLSVVVDSSIV